MPRRPLPARNQNVTSHPTGARKAKGYGVSIIGRVEFVLRGGSFRSIPHVPGDDRGRRRAAASAPRRTGQADRRGAKRQRTGHEHAGRPA